MPNSSVRCMNLKNTFTESRPKYIENQSKEWLKCRKQNKKNRKSFLHFSLSIFKPSTIFAVSKYMILKT